MTAIEWDAAGKRFYENGTDRGVLYPMTSNGSYDKGVAWNGLTAVTESPEGAEPTDLYADNIKYATMRSAETFGCTIEAYTYPDEFSECDGSAQIAKGVFAGQQERKGFGFSYRTLIGNDTATSSDDGYKLHLVYGCTASPSEKSYATVNDSPDAITFSWEVKTTPVNVAGFKPTATLVIDSRYADPSKLAALEKTLYGDADTEASLPLPAAVITAMGAVEARSVQASGKSI
nr:MAG TPA: tail tube protein [Caudoviricetes sp.]